MPFAVSEAEFLSNRSFSEIIAAAKHGRPSKVENL